MKKGWAYIEKAKIVLCPANAISTKIKYKLIREGAHIEGFFDNHKTDEYIFNSAEDIPPDCKILITPTHYARTLYDQLTKSRQVADVFFIDENLNIHEHIRKKNRFIFGRLVISCLSRLKISETTIFLGVPFVDHNLYYAYLSLRKIHPKENCHLIDHEQLRHKSNLWTKYRAWARLIFCDVLVLDHETTDEKILAIRANKRVVQLWHGIPFKRLSGNRGYLKNPDELFISSSTTANSLYFSKQYWAKNYSNAGYPRNDNLYTTWLNRDFSRSVDRKQLELMKGQYHWLGIYMPTWRDSNEDKFFLDLLSMQNFLESKNGILFLKLHPFEAANLTTERACIPIGEKGLEQLSEFSNIYIFPSQLDIYPLIPEANALITDYSSVVFDVATTKVPIIFFQPDLESYEEYRGKSYIANERFCIGPLAKTTCELITILGKLQHEYIARFENKRVRLVQDFELKPRQSGERVANLINSVRQK